MARRAKGPTSEELIEKLQKDFEAFKEESKERTDEIERKSEEQIELVKDEYQKKIAALKEDHEEAEKKHTSGKTLRKISTKKEENIMPFLSICPRWNNALLH